LSKKARLKAHTPSLQWALQLVTSLPQQGDQIMAVVLTSRRRAPNIALGDRFVVVPWSVKLIVNVKVAKALGLTVPPSLIARADEVIE
jgi:hypothetical protein